MRTFKVVSFLAASLFSTNAALAGTIEGTVTVKGSVPAPKKLDVKADKKCAAIHAKSGGKIDSEELIASGGKVQWVLVSVKNAPKSSKKLPKAVLDQKGCHYVPHVFGLMKGQELEIRNSDPLLHNIHPLPKVNREFNDSQPNKGMKAIRKFDKVETTPFKIKCNIHKWMSAHTAVYDHPFFAVTDANGKYVIKDIPNGTYTVEFWHEKLGKKTQTVKVSGTGKADVSF